MSTQYKKFTTVEQISNWIHEMKLSNYRINIANEYAYEQGWGSLLTVDFFDDVNLNNKELKFFPIQFGIVIGNFSCAYNQFQTLEGLPTQVQYNFICDIAPHLNFFDNMPKCLGDLIGLVGEISDRDLKKLTHFLEHEHQDGWIHHHCPKKYELEAFHSHYQLASDESKLHIQTSQFKPILDSYLEKLQLEKQIETKNSLKKVKI